MENLETIFLSALASIAATLAVVWWLTSKTEALMNRTALQLSTALKHLRSHEAKLEQLERDVKQHASTALKAELADLAVALDRDRDRSRREFGRLWAKHGRSPGGNNVIEGEVDAELQAMLDLQNAAGGTQ